MTVYFNRFLEDLAKAQGCDSLQWIKLLQGIAMGVQCFAGEAPFLFLSGTNSHFSQVLYISRIITL